MKNGVRKIVYDGELQIEGYRFIGIMEAFPNHFHEYYTIGVIENGQRTLSCKNRISTVKKGSILLFNPFDNHACIQTDGGSLDYRAFNISKETMLNLTEKITGKKETVRFYKNTVFDEEIAQPFEMLHQAVMGSKFELNKKETLLFIIGLLIKKYAFMPERQTLNRQKEIENACNFIKRHYSKRIYLEEVCHFSGLSKSTLLRRFVKEKGVTPWEYLENIRINKAKRMLRKGMPPVETALRAGFSSQSHFTNYFSRYMGLSPSVYQKIFQDKGKTL